MVGLLEDSWAEPKLGWLRLGLSGGGEGLLKTQDLLVLAGPSGHYIPKVGTAGQDCARGRARNSLKALVHQSGCELGRGWRILS